jgi:hypothetical protein
LRERIPGYRQRDPAEAPPFGKKKGLPQKLRQSFLRGNRGILKGQGEKEKERKEREKRMKRKEREREEKMKRKVGTSCWLHYSINLYNCKEK